MDIVLEAPQHLIPPHIGGALPSYFIYAGIVFTPLTLPYIHDEISYGDGSIRDIVHTLKHGELEFEHQQHVIINQILPAYINAGYERFDNVAIARINGVSVRNLLHLVELVEYCNTTSLVFDLADHRMVVLDTTESRASNAMILDTYSIHRQYSRDVAAVLQRCDSLGECAAL